MILIGENVHIISKSVKTALENKDENFVKNLIKIQRNLDAIDLNIGPAKGKLDNVFEWLLSMYPQGNFSFDSSDINAIERALKSALNAQNCFINSTSADDDKLKRCVDLALEYNCNLIALSMSKQTGIPKSSDGRMELVLKIYEYCLGKGLSANKIFFDPLVLPVKVDNSQPVEALNTIRMISESFAGELNTVIGLSNVSNGISKELRPLFNRVFAVLSYGAGLSGAIIDAKDTELIRILKMLECNNPKSDVDKLYINLSNMIQCFMEIEDIDFDKNDKEQSDIVKIARVLLGKKIYSDNFLQV